jgi:hypothetical protein
MAGWSTQRDRTCRCDLYGNDRYSVITFAVDAVVILIRLLHVAVGNLLVYGEVDSKLPWHMSSHHGSFHIRAPQLSSPEPSMA